ncbi:MAG: hypothetical protein VB144_13525 [Clostridia bacterium]|nr:hypothetical protein [Clostridia bacterium]
MRRGRLAKAQGLFSIDRSYNPIVVELRTSAPIRLDASSQH